MSIIISPNSPSYLALFSQFFVLFCFDLFGVSLIQLNRIANFHAEDQSGENYNLEEICLGRAKATANRTECDVS